MNRCAVCGEAITEVNIFITIPQSLEDDLFFCSCPECVKTVEIFIQIDGIRQRIEQIRDHRRTTSEAE